MIRWYREARRTLRTLKAIQARAFITPSCSHCGQPVVAPDCHWHPWVGYIHRHCWQPMLEDGAHA